MRSDDVPKERGKEIAKSHFAIVSEHAHEVVDVVCEVHSSKRIVCKFALPLEACFVVAVYLAGSRDIPVALFLQRNDAEVIGFVESSVLPDAVAESVEAAGMPAELCNLACGFGVVIQIDFQFLQVSLSCTPLVVADAFQVLAELRQGIEFLHREFKYLFLSPLVLDGKESSWRVFVKDMVKWVHRKVAPLLFATFRNAAVCTILLDEAVLSQVYLSLVFFRLPAFTAFVEDDVAPPFLALAELDQVLYIHFQTGIVGYVRGEFRYCHKCFVLFEVAVFFLDEFLCRPKDKVFFFKLFQF